MEINKATIKRDASNTYLVLEINEQTLQIILTDDNPNNVKSVFNTLLKNLKNGLFQFNFEDETQDLYHHICKEYITQLNAEIKGVYGELSDYELIQKQ